MSKQQQQQKPNSGSRRRARLWLVYDRGDHLDAVIEFPSATDAKTNGRNLHLVRLPFDDVAFVAKVKDILKAAENDLASAATRFIEVGRMLLDRKESGKRDGTIPHGEWKPWIEKNLPHRSYPRLAEYMRVAEAMEDEDTKIRMSELLPLGFDAVLNEVRNLKRRSKPKTAPLVDDVAGEDLQILVGDCRERLKELPDKSVHMVATSSPYFALRCYDVEPTIWGGDRNCEHDWSTHERSGMSGMSSRERVRGTHGFDASEYSFCRKCGAWRGCLGLEPTPELYVEHICEVFDEVWRVLRDDGTLWLVIGDSFNSGPPGANPGGFQGAAMRANPAYNSAQSRKPIKGGYRNGLKPKDLIGVPWMLAFALRARGWYLRSEIIWHKRNMTPESVTDRPTKSHETVFLLTKQADYYFDADAIKEPAVSVNDRRKGLGRIASNGKCLGESGTGRRSIISISEDDTRNARTVWTIATEPFAGDHFAPFPKALIKPIALAGCPEGGVMLDPFAGTGTTGLVANALGRNAVLIEANPEYAAMAKQRIDKELAEYKAKCAREDAWGNVINRDDDEPIGKVRVKAAE